MRAAVVLVASTCAATAFAAEPSRAIPAGAYARVETPLSQEFLTLRLDGSYEMSSSDEASLWTVRGVASRSNDTLTLSEPGPREVGSLRIVEWGEHLFLVEPGDLGPFCSFAERVTSGAKGGVNEPVCVFYRPRDTEKAYPTEVPSACTRRITTR